MTVKGTWEDRDFPVLQAIVAHLEETGDDSFSPGDLTRFLDSWFDESDIQKALNALQGHQPAVLIGPMSRTAAGSIFHVRGGVTGHARQLVGLWPQPGQLQDRLLNRLDAAEAAAADEDSKRRIRRAREAITELGGETLKKIVMGWIGLS